MAERGAGWECGEWRGWRDLDGLRRCLARGADPEDWHGERPLHVAAVLGSPEVVAELAGHVANVDALWEGTTALWEAVVDRRWDNARALVAAGADPWAPVAGGWSPGRLSLALPGGRFFTRPADERGLSPAERAVAEESGRLVAVLEDLHIDGTGLACVAGIDAAEAVRRLDAVPVRGRALAELEGADEYDIDTSMRIVGVTTVPGGCVVTQPWGYTPQSDAVLARLAAGTRCYGLYANPKSGNQGCIARDGTIRAGDLHPGGGPDPCGSPEEIFLAFLYADHAAAHACAWAGLGLTEARAVTGPPDIWVELPDRGDGDD
ncbi:ankyrin repeat domain-containing protein [Streptomyces sp. NPDC000594]|uniref:ankyrin repeat domain-containing protein n=1 Tax=Streptomyces sp. NPDC000594 TaxID=3154261 RepID=UPI00332B87CB